MKSSAVPQNSKAKTLPPYRKGNRDTRPWGEYVVTDVGVTKDGDEFCEKIITIKPGQILSLQSHNYRRERWTVQQGVLSVVLDGKRLELQTGESIEIPVGAVHCMANVGLEACKVHERQEGICREDDIIRYVDAYGRNVQAVEQAQNSIEQYNTVLSDMKNIT